MVIDAELAPIVELVNAGGGTPPAELGAERLRSDFRALTTLRGPGPELAAVEDRTVPGPAGPVPVRIYRPSTDEALPALVWFHGGGFVIGDLDTHDRECRLLARDAGVAVVAVDYRLAPEHPFPAAVEDAWAALGWVAEHGAEVGIDPDRLAVGGDSAGGDLAAVMTRHCRDRGGPDVSFQLLVYPVTDALADGTTHPSRSRYAEGMVLTAQTMDFFLDAYVPDAAHREDPDVSPLRAADLSGLPPALVITAELDPLRDEGEAYARRLAEAGVPVTTSRYEGAVHLFFQMSDVTAIGRRAVDEAAAALRDHLT